MVSYLSRLLYNIFEEMSCRLEVLRALIGRIPPNHLWAELLWQRQQELTQ